MKRKKKRRCLRSNRDVPKNTFGVNKEQPPQRNTLVLKKNTIVAGNFHGFVSDERELEVRS